MPILDRNVRAGAQDRRERVVKRGWSYLVRYPWSNEFNRMPWECSASIASFDWARPPWVAASSVGLHDGRIEAAQVRHGPSQAKVARPVNAGPDPRLFDGEDAVLH
jgi:hypothetical protein